MKCNDSGEAVLGTGFGIYIANKSHSITRKSQAE